MDISIKKAKVIYFLALRKGVLNHEIKNAPGSPQFAQRRINPRHNIRKTDGEFCAIVKFYSLIYLRLEVHQQILETHLHS